jgi:hypothetical protein
MRVKNASRGIDTQKETAKWHIARIFIFSFFFFFVPTNPTMPAPSAGASRRHRRIPCARPPPQQAAERAFP